MCNRIEARELVFKGFREEISMTTEYSGMQIKKQSILENNQEIHLCFIEKTLQLRRTSSVGEMWIKS